MLLQVMQDVIDCLGGTFAGLVITTIVSPLVVLVYIPVVALFEAIRRRYIACSRELKRLDSLAVSPVLSTFTETLQAHARPPCVCFDIFRALCTCRCQSWSASRGQIH